MKDLKKKGGIHSKAKSRSSSDIVLLIVLFSFVAFALYSIISSLFGNAPSNDFSDVESNYTLSRHDYFLLDAPENNYLGNLNSSIVVEIYTDLECPYCRTLHESLDSLNADYGDVVKFIYYHFPLSNHANARSAAIAAECAKMQGYYYEYMDEVYSAGYLKGNSLFNLAESLGLDMEKFNACVSDPVIAIRVDDMKSAGLAAGVRGTPSVFVNGTQLSSWSPSSIELAIEKLIE